VSILKVPLLRLLTFIMVFISHVRNCIHIHTILYIFQARDENCCC
jgi:hypothetical protein